MAQPAVLVHEPDRAVRRLIRTILESNGFAVLDSAPDGTRPDVVVSGGPLPVSPTAPVVYFSKPFHTEDLVARVRAAASSAASSSVAPLSGVHSREFRC